jgi:predicted nucleic acid-binding protein
MVILADTSVWVDHFRQGVPRLVDALGEQEILMHPFVLGELACGNLSNRAEVLSLLAEMPMTATASDDEALSLIETRALMGRGIGYIDVHLLASAFLSGAVLWTTDKRLAAVAKKLGVAFAGSTPS